LGLKERKVYTNKKKKHHSCPFSHRHSSSTLFIKSTRSALPAVVIPLHSMSLCLTLSWS